jgi:hypothetical protein
MGHAKENIMGDPNDVSNVFKWKEVRLPGATDYDPSMAWMANMSEDGRVATSLHLSATERSPKLGWGGVRDGGIVGGSC